MFYMIRHGETDWNIKGLAQDCKYDIPLNENGIEQARCSAKAFKDKNISKIYTSPMLRTKKTSEIIKQELDVPVLYSPLLVETNYGVLHGQNMEEVVKSGKYQYIFDRADAGDNDVCFPEGESRNVVTNRFLKFLQSVEITENDKNILIVSHGGTIRTIRFVLTGIDEHILNCNGISFDLDKDKRPVNIQLFKYDSCEF